jgi:cell wall-associated NlpC family hydrolase
MNKITDTARSYLGAKWVHCGRTKDEVDCTGLLVCVFRDLGYAIEDFAPYAPDIDQYEALVARIERYCDRVYTLNPGDILLFRKHGMPNHCGIYLGNDRFIHSYNKPAIKQVVEQTYSDMWKKITTAVYRIRGEEWLSY